MRLEEIKDLSLRELEIQEVTISDNAVFAQTGGRRISLTLMGDFRQSVLDIASQWGFPGESSEGQKSKFDAACAFWLRRHSQIEIGEGLRDDIWSYLTLELLPDVATWRFPQRNSRRFLGGVRNTFQRLWRRAFLVDYARDSETLRDYLDSLQEDSFVQLIERPGFSANPYIASRVAAAWVKASKEPQYGPMEALHRVVMKELTQLGAVVKLDALAQEELDSLLDDLYTDFAGQKR